MFSFFLASSIHYPRSCPRTKWIAEGITVQSITNSRRDFAALFIDHENRIYVGDEKHNELQVWSEDSVIPIRTIANFSLHPHSIFVTSSNDIFVSDHSAIRQISGSMNAFIHSNAVVQLTGYCWALFVDRRQTLYCSINDGHIVITRSLNNAWTVTRAEVGTGFCRSSSSELCRPSGIYVDSELNLYIADTGNHRIQWFKYGSSVAETWYDTTDPSFAPRDIVVDVRGDVWVADENNHQILRCSRKFCQCTIGCNGQIRSPSHFGFDRLGNLFVLDKGNARIQKFLADTSFCSKSNPLFLLLLFHKKM